MLTDAICPPLFPDIVFHAAGSIFFSLITINKGHYLYLWYTVLFISLPQLLCELFGMGTVLLLNKRRW
tara:strand:+ start:193 stop:396 length:204 start_codon:yes stop_codon:yes gene_type:complete